MLTNLEDQYLCRNIIKYTIESENRRRTKIKFIYFTEKMLFSNLKKGQCMRSRPIYWI
jgi:hypothetical protein